MVFESHVVDSDDVIDAFCFRWCEIVVILSDVKGAEEEVEGGEHILTH